MLKKFFLLASVVFVMCSFTGTINYFYGTITYEIKYETNDPLISTEMLAKQYGTEVKINWDGNGFQEEYKGGYVISRIYSMEKNTLSTTRFSAENPLTQTSIIDCSKANETIKS